MQTTDDHSSEICFTAATIASYQIRAWSIGLTPCATAATVTVCLIAHLRQYPDLQMQSCRLVEDFPRASLPLRLFAPRGPDSMVVCSKSPDPGLLVSSRTPPMPRYLILAISSQASYLSRAPAKILFITRCDTNVGSGRVSGDSELQDLDNSTLYTDISSLARSSF